MFNYNWKNKSIIIDIFILHYLKYKLFVLKRTFSSREEIMSFAMDQLVEVSQKSFKLRYTSIDQ